LENSWKEKKEIEINSGGYRIKRKIKNFIQKLTPNFLMYSYYKTKRILKDIFKDVSGFFDRTWQSISDKIIKILSYIKDGFVKIISDIKRIGNGFKSIFKSKKTKEGDKKKDGKKP
jgi:hypothetical protein